MRPGAAAKRRRLRPPPGVRPRGHPGGCRSARALRGGGELAARPLEPALAADPGDPGPGEPEAGLLPLDGVPARPLARQQCHEPRGRGAGPRGPELRPAPGLGRGPGDRAGRGPRQRRPRAARRLLHRIAGDPADPGHGLRPALRVRHLPAGDRQRLAGRAARPLAAAPRPLGGGASARDGARAARLLLRPGGGHAPGGARPSVVADGRALRPAGRGLRRQGDQQPAALGRGLTGLLRFRRVQHRRLRGRPGRSRGRRDGHAGALSRRLHGRRDRRCGSCRSTSWSPARWPTSSPAFAAATTGRPCPTRSRSSSTTRTPPWRWRS